MFSEFITICTNQLLRRFSIKNNLRRNRRSLFSFFVPPSPWCLGRLNLFYFQKWLLRGFPSLLSTGLPLPKGCRKIRNLCTCNLRQSQTDIFAGCWLSQSLCLPWTGPTTPRGSPAPGMVDQFKKQLAALSVPYPEDKGVSSQIDAQAKEAEKKVTQFVSESKARIAGYEAELAKWEVVPAFDQMTMEEFRDHFPDLALDPVNRPTFWPHTPEAQQPDEPAAH
ncbi:ATP synthase subunit d, mitochondrial [Amphibalanus amphitrite]|uniref:ATP synthase subunit d, mitochondrial n=1 Tax=Amphibalanus amphitrite TaxID=1232801 RepID=A0A6A4W0H3_AMPAM|nr:ATP synthase subunit d, mitochondrial [Amphibalanus amphitrite]